MPYPSRVEEQLKSGEYLPVGWPWRIFSLSLVIFIIAVLVYAGINFGYRPYLNKQIKTLDAEFLDLNQSIDEEKQNQLISFYSQIVNIGDVLNSRDNTFPIFDFLEKNTYPRTAYKNININAGNSRIDMDVSTENYYTFAQQAREFEANDAVEKLDFGGLSLDPATNNVSYRLTLNIKPKFFKVGDRE